MCLKDHNLVLGRKTIFERSLVPIWRQHGFLSMDFGNPPHFRNIQHCTTFQLPFNTQSAKTVNNDPIFTSLLEIFYAKIQDQSNLQVFTHHKNGFSR